MTHTLPVRYAGFWVRLIADLIDSTLLSLLSWGLELGLLYGIYFIWSWYARGHGEAVPPFSDAFNAFYLQMFNLGVYFCIAFPYYVWGHFRYGTTLGKYPFRIYVVNAGDLAPLSLRQSIARCFGFLISYLPFATGYLMAAYHPQKRALHDLIAGTVSIRRSPA